ncbi:MAG: flagellar motor switch protein FliM [Alphaproteobacteria bacterium]|jgi:flagellar motor switch protein FliM
MSDTAVIIKRKIQETIARADNYPLLEIITNSLQRGMGTRLRSIFSRPVEVMLDSKEILRFGDYFDTLMFPAILCIFESDRLPGRGLVFMEGRFMENAIEMLLGFSEDRDANREARIPTSIDKTLIMNLVDQCLSELSNCFKNAHADIGEITFSAIAVETTPQFAMITTEVTPCHISKFFFDIGEAGYGGRMDIVMPIPMLSPIRRYLEQSFRGDGHGDDKIWQQTIAYAVAKHPITLHAEIEMQHITLNDIYDWKVGDMIDLQSDTPPELSLTYRNGKEEHLLAKGDLGTLKNKKAIKITDEIINQFTKDLSDILLESQVMVKTPNTKKLKFIK